MSLRREKDVADDIDDLRRKVDKLLRKGIDKLQNSYIRKVTTDLISFTKEIVKMNDPSNVVTVTKDAVAFANESVTPTKCTAFYLGSTPGGTNDCLVTMGFWEVF